MSLHNQEEVLFHLLFDRRLRERFRRDPQAALAAYGLSAAEAADFAAVRHDALALEADLRADLILSQLCRTYPLSFSLMTSLVGGLDLLKSLIDTDTMQEHPLQRAPSFGARLRAWVDEDCPEAEDTRNGVIGILNAETGMAWTSAALRLQWLHGEAAPDAPPSGLPEEWEFRPLRAAASVGWARLPRPYGELKERLCPGGGAALWRSLARCPTSAETRDQALAAVNPRLLAHRAVLTRPSRCEPVAEHAFLELAEGFAPLLEHLDGEQTVTGLLNSLAAAGAPAGLLPGIRNGFRQLLEQRMLVLVP